MNFRKLTFSNRHGQRLAARLDLPVDGEPRAYALFAHCFTCTKNLKAIGHLSTALNEAGYAVLRFDFTGLGESEGDFADTNFSSNIEDLVDAARFLAAQYEGPKLLVGHSLGGAAVLQAAHHLDSVAAVATIGAPFDPEHVSHLFETALDEIDYAGEARVSLGGRPFTITKQFLDDLRTQNVVRHLHGLDRALLVLHSPVDATVGIENARMIFDHARHPKSFVSLDEADHLLSDEADARYVGAVLAAWARKYVGPVPEARQQRALTDNRITAYLEGTGFRTEIMANGHALVADEPASVGGTDAGPSPYDLLAASLGACTAMTLRLYADRKQWPLEAVTVGLHHKKVHAEDCDCDRKPEGGLVDVIARTITLEGTLDAEQRQRLLEIANRCPVHRSLEAGVVVKTTLAEGDHQNPHAGNPVTA